MIDGLFGFLRSMRAQMSPVNGKEGTRKAEGGMSKGFT